jgi:ribonuclease HI
MEIFLEHKLCGERIALYLPHEAETWSLKEALHWIKNLGYTNVFIEPNCKLVVDGVVGNLNSKTEFGAILSLCKVMLLLLQNLRISFIRKQANNVAHLLFIQKKCCLFAS